MTLDKQAALLWQQRETAAANVRLAETALEAAERELRRIDEEHDRVTELQWQETERRMRRSA